MYVVYKIEVYTMEVHRFFSLMVLKVKYVQIREFSTRHQSQKITDQLAIIIHFSNFEKRILSLYIILV